MNGKLIVIEAEQSADRDTMATSLASQSAREFLLRYAFPPTQPGGAAAGSQPSKLAATKRTPEPWLTR